MWGYVEPNLRAHGDLGQDFTAELRASLQRRYPSPARDSLLLGAARRGFSVWPRPAWKAQPRDDRVGVLLTHRLLRTAGASAAEPPPLRTGGGEAERAEAALRAVRSDVRSDMVARNTTNQGELRRALLELARGSASPPLRLLAGPLERLPLAAQLHLMLHHVEVMVQPFGAGLAWSALAPAGSYVLELQQDGVGTTNFVSCFPLGGEGGEAGPWQPINIYLSLSLSLYIYIYTHTHIHIHIHIRIHIHIHIHIHTYLLTYLHTHTDICIYIYIYNRQPPSNPRSEWGAWALMNGVNFACVTRRPT